MRVVECVQGSPEWRAARLGIPTASCFDRILTPKKLELSKSADDYRAQLLAEWLLGEPCDGFDAQAFVERGKEFEPRARAAYAFEYDAAVREVGFVLTDDRRAGCSPDGLIDAERAGLEIKIPSAKEHVAYMLDPARLRDAYRIQCLGGLLATGLETWFLYAWNPLLPSVRVAFRWTQEVDALEKMEDALAEFCSTLEADKARLLAMGCTPYAERQAEEAGAAKSRAAEEDERLFGPPVPAGEASAPLPSEDADFTTEKF